MGASGAKAKKGKAVHSLSSFDLKELYANGGFYSPLSRKVLDAGQELKRRLLTEAPTGIDTIENG